MQMKQIVLVRHGSIEDKYTGCYIGSTNVPLSKKGVKEAAAAGEYLKRFEFSAMYSSPLLRCRETICEILSEEDFEKVTYKGSLEEIDFGEWEGMRFSEIAAKYPDFIEQWQQFSPDFAFPGGTSMEDFYNRLKEFRQLLLRHTDDAILVVTHGGVISAFICLVLDIGFEKMLAFKPERGSISIVNLFENGSGTLNALNIKPDVPEKKKKAE